jgi:BASS family bile acid:Na+ symporter
MTYLAGGNVALSVSMTAVSTAAAVVTTPLHLALWGGLNPATAPILRRVSLDPWEVFSTIALILGLPLALGIAAAHGRPRLADRVRPFFKRASVVVFGAMVAAALAANWTAFLRVIGLVAVVVFVHNGLALALGYLAARSGRLDARDLRAVTIEVGIQNSGLGLVLVFNFFEGLGGMAVVAAWWGIWHIVSGLALASYWARRPAAS